MRVQQVPNSPYFIHYDDEGFCCISKSRESQEPIPESEMQAFLDAVANGLLYIEKERKSRYQRIDEAEKAAFAKGKAKGREDELLSTVRECQRLAFTDNIMLRNCANCRQLKVDELQKLRYRG